LRWLSDCRGLVEALPLPDVDEVVARVHTIHTTASGELELVAVEFGAPIELEGVDGVPQRLLLDNDVGHEDEPRVDIVGRHVHAV
jgi:hypothetical protein